MDYKEKYNTAIKRAKKLQETCDSTTVVGWCEYIFPELKESEDEKIRKAIISCCIDHGSKYKYLGVSMEEMCAWLEKQGHMLDSDKVIEWLYDQACQGWIEDVEVDIFVDKFKKDFGL